MHLTQSSTCKGFTLLEVMIAVLVLGIGLLGMAHLQITSLKQSQSAEFRSQASVLTADMFDRMRANQSAAQKGDYNLNLDASSPNENATMAKADITQWLARITGVLPEGDGAIDCPAFPPDQAFICDITISWTEVQEDGDLGTTSFIYSGAL